MSAASKVIMGLTTLGAQRAIRHAPSKGVPSVVARKVEKQSKAKEERAFRDEVWTRDKSRSRASGRPLTRNSVNPEERGEVDHVIDRSIAPARVLDVTNALLLSARENRLKKTPCAGAPEFRMLTITGPDNRAKEQLFTWRNVRGVITRQRKG